MSSDESLRLPARLEPPHPSLPHPCRLMRLLRPIIFILFSTVDSLGYQLSMGNSITSQFICNDLPWLTTMIPQQALEEPLSRSPIPLCLKIDAHNLAILIDGSPQIMLLPVNLHKDFINVEGVAVAPVLALQSVCINSTELDTPEADRFAADGDTPFGE